MWREFSPSQPERMFKGLDVPVNHSMMKAVSICVAESNHSRWMSCASITKKEPTPSIGGARASYTRLMGFAPMGRLIWQRA